MKSIYLVIILILSVFVGCSEEQPTEQVQLTSIDNLDMDSTIIYTVSNQIKVEELYGKWKLERATFSTGSNVVDSLGSFFKFNDEERMMYIEEKKIEKINFYYNPTYLEGAVNLSEQDLVNIIHFCPEGYANLALELFYSYDRLLILYGTELKFNKRDKLHKGFISESYTKVE